MSLRFITAGESHGPGLTAIVEGLPPASSCVPRTSTTDLARRQLGHGRGGRMKIEKDRAEVTAGVRHGRTLGSPVALRIDNRDYANWEERMNPWPVDAEVAEVHLPRPGHADLAGRPEVRLHRRAQRARARERARDRRPRGRRGARQGLPARAGRRRSLSHVTRIGSVAAPAAATTWRPPTSRAWTSRRCAASTPRRAQAMVAEIDAARKANESLGGVFEVRAFGLVPGPRLARLVGGAPRRPPGAGDHVDPGHEGRRDRRRLRPRRPRRLAGPRRDLLDRGAGLLPRDQPRRRRGGRHDHRRPADRARRP